jgi:biopolymer transport protein ExbD
MASNQSGSGNATGNGAITGINVTPLVDIVLVLLIIFMATAHLIAHRSINLNLPKVANAQESPTQSVHVLLKADKTLVLNDTKVTMQELTVNLSQMARIDTGLHVTLGADERVSWGDVANVLDTIRGAGITHVATEVEVKAKL